MEFISIIVNLISLNLNIYTYIYIFKTTIMTIDLKEIMTIDTHIHICNLFYKCLHYIYNLNTNYLSSPIPSHSNMHSFLTSSFTMVNLACNRKYTTIKA